MNRLLQTIVVFYLLVIVFMLVSFSEANDKTVANRPKRFLSFKNSTRFFIRFNIKNNMVPWTQIFAESVGFRINWDEPPDTFHPYHRLYRRSVYSKLQTILDRNGFDGFNCIRRTICEIANVSRPRGIYHKILKIVFRQKSSDTDTWHKMTSQDCVTSFDSCPFSLLDISTYTDE